MPNTIGILPVFAYHPKGERPVLLSNAFALFDFEMRLPFSTLALTVGAAMF
jgi:hypothetical protein